MSCCQLSDGPGSLGLGVLDHVPLVQDEVVPLDAGQELHVTPHYLIGGDDQVVMTSLRLYYINTVQLDFVTIQN